MTRADEEEVRSLRRRLLLIKTEARRLSARLEGLDDTAANACTEAAEHISEAAQELVELL